MKILLFFLFILKIVFVTLYEKNNQYTILQCLIDTILDTTPPHSIFVFLWSDKHSIFVQTM
jgi:hypothetical protein